MGLIPRGALPLAKTRGVRGVGGGRLFPDMVAGGRWTRRGVSSSVRRCLLFVARVRMS